MQDAAAAEATQHNFWRSPPQKEVGAGDLLRLAEEEAAKLSAVHSCGGASADTTLDPTILMAELLAAMRGASTPLRPFLAVPERPPASRTSAAQKGHDASSSQRASRRSPSHRGRRAAPDSFRGPPSERSGGKSRTRGVVTTRGGAPSERSRSGTQRCGGGAPSERSRSGTQRAGGAPPSERSRSGTQRGGGQRQAVPASRTGAGSSLAAIAENGCGGGVVPRVRSAPPGRPRYLKQSASLRQPLPLMVPPPRRGTEGPPPTTPPQHMPSHFHLHPGLVNCGTAASAARSIRSYSPEARNVGRAEWLRDWKESRRRLAHEDGLMPF